MVFGGGVVLVGLVVLAVLAGTFAARAFYDASADDAQTPPPTRDDRLPR